MMNLCNLSNKRTEVRELIENLDRSMRALHSSGIITNVSVHSFESYRLSDVRYENTECIIVHFIIDERTLFVIKVSFTIVEDEIKNKLFVWDPCIREKEKYAFPELKTYLTEHPSLQYKDSSENNDIDYYINKDVPSGQIVTAFIATLMSLQEFCNRYTLIYK